MGSFNMGGWATTLSRIYTWLMSAAISGSSSGFG